MVRHQGLQSIYMKIIVRVTPDSRREHFEKTGDVEFKASVKESAERNQANMRVQELVAEHFNLPVTTIRFLTGMRSKKKVFEVVQ